MLINISRTVYQSKFIFKHQNQIYIQRNMHFLWVTLFSIIQLAPLLKASLASVSLIIDNSTTIIYDINGYSSQFVSNHNIMSCSYNSLFTYTQSGTAYTNNSPYSINITGITSPTSISISTQYSIISPTLSLSSCSTNCSIQITNNCPNPIGYFNYFDGLNPLTYNVLCNKQFGKSTFQAGMFIIIIISVVVIILASIYSRAWSFYTKGIQILYPYIFVYNILQAIGGTVLILAPNVAQIIGDVVIWFFGIFGMVTCFNQILYLFKIQMLPKYLINIKSYGVRITDVITFFISIGILLGWILSDKNWVLNDIISYCVIIATIKVFKITSLKKAIIFYLIQLAIEIVFVILIDVLEKQSYEDFLLNEFNNPLQIQLPTINPVYGLKCSWLPISATILPGILISYFRRFDNSRHTNIYLVTSSVSYLIGSILWVIITVVSPRNFPFQLISEPAMICLVCLFAFTRKQLRILWNGKFYDGQFKNQQQQQQGKYNYEMEARQVQFKQTFLNGLKINKEQDSQIQSGGQRGLDQQEKVQKIQKIPNVVDIVDQFRKADLMRVKKSSD